MYVAHLCRELHERVVYQLLTDNVYIQGTSINNSFIRETVFYHWNERFVSHRTGHIIFSRTSSEQTSRRRVPKQRNFP